MKTAYKALLGTWLLLAASILLGKVTTDYDHETDFSRYHTFQWIREPQTKNPLMRDRVRDAINSELIRKNFSMVASGGDLGVAANGATQEKHTLQTFYDGWDGGWLWNRRFGGPIGPAIATTTIDTYEVGTLVVDLFDSKTRQLVWRATATGTIHDDPEKNIKKLNDAVEDMFKKFPPKESHKG